jgi:Pycsar effector protein
MAMTVGHRSRACRRWTGGACDSGDARFFIDHFTRWIANADTKAGMLAAAQIIMAGALGDQGRTVVHRLPPGSPAEWAALVALLVATAGVALSIGFLIRTVRPRIEAAGGFSRYSFASVADAAIADLVRVDRGADREQGWRTAAILAAIARRKFRDLQRAFGWWAFAGVAFLVLALMNLGR